MLKLKNIGMFIKRTSKVICWNDRIRTCSICAPRISLCAHYANAYEHAHNFRRPVEHAKHKT